MKKYIFIISMIMIWSNVFSQDHVSKLRSTPIDLSYIPTGFNVDKSKSIGEISIQATPTNTGALSYNIPIETYPGRDGIQPNISLVYNSQSPNGLVGTGWNIGGLSSIVIANKNLYYDGIVKPRSGKNDAYYMDGGRLIEMGNNTYQTESGNIKIQRYSSENGGYYFKVKYPNGTTTATYGYQSSTREFSNVSYPLTRLEDKKGNYIDYHYQYKDNQYFISEIKYGGSASLPHFASIEFSYRDKGYQMLGFINGTPLEQNQILDKIDIYCNSILLRSYIPEYESRSSNGAIIDVFMKRLNCSVSNGETINPFIFYYGSNENGYYNISHNNINDVLQKQDTTKINILTAQLDPLSGRNGLIVYPRKNGYKFTWLGVGSEYGDATQGKGDTIFIYKDIHTNKIASKIPILSAEMKGSYGNFRGLYLMDIDGSNQERIITLNSHLLLPRGTEETLSFNIFDANGVVEDYFEIKRNNEVFKHRIPNSTSDVNCPVNRIYVPGDYYGNGRKNMLFFRYSKDVLKNKWGSKMTFVDFSKKEIIYEEECFDINLEDFVFSFDYNGDGKDEICHVRFDDFKKNIHFDIYSFNIPQSSESALKLIATAFLPAKEPYMPEILVGDINGDGNFDILVSPANDGNNERWTCIMSRGNGDYDTDGGIGVRIYGFDIPHKENTEYAFHDMDSDGLPELICRTENGELKIYPNIHGKLSVTPSHTSSIGKHTYFAVTNIQDGHKLNKLIYLNDKTLTSVAHSTNRNMERMLTGVITSSGVIYKNSYSSLMNTGIYEISGIQSTYPHNKLYADIGVLSNTTTYLNDEIVSSDFFKYKNAIIHKQGLGFRGFEQITRIDSIRDRTFVQHFDPYNFSVLKSEDCPFGKATYDYIFDIKDNKIAKILLNSKEETDKLKGTTVRSSYQYDSYGNPIEETIDFGSGIISTTSTKLSNIDTGAIYLLGRLDEQSVKNTRGGSSAISKTAISYNDKHLPVSKISYYNNNKTSEESYVYYDNMDLKESKTKAYSSDNWLTTKYEYDTQGRIKRETDPYGLYVDHTYNNRGQLETKKSYLGHITFYTYDSWGRNTQTSYPDGAVETNTLEWATSPGGALYVAKSTMTGQPEAETYYDALGREIRKGAKRFDGTYLYTDYKYDSKGRLEKTSLPFKGNTPSLWNEYSYDGYDRIISLTYASGKKDSYSYNKLQTTSITDGILVERTEDAAGKVRKIKDEAGIIAYNYRPDGQLRSIIAPGNIKTSFVYDRYGRQTMLKDPSAGDKSYEYDDAGNIVKETDADGKTIRIQYDAYNRIISKEISDGFTSTYTYDSNSLLTSISESNGISKTYEYDNLLRLKKEKETIVDNHYLEKNYTYSGNTLSSVSYGSQSGNIVAENYIYANGYHTETKLNSSTSIWKLTAENTLGMPVSSVTGELSRTYTYDTYGMPTGRSIRKGNTTIQNFSYHFDPTTGNLNWRKDNTRNLTENFGYDHMNRLTDFSGNTIVYNKRGNITDHSGVGYFGYSKDKPYAIEGVSPYEEVIPMRDQHISYNALMRPDSISEGEYKAALQYDIDGSRIKMHLKKGDNDELVRYYIGGQYEIDHTLAGVEERLYLDGDAYSAAVVYVRKGSNPWQVQYIGRDYLGSITHITDATGNLKEEYSYDPWGRLRNPQDHTLYEADENPALLLARGYTGHEHLLMFGLINMNARLYDPVTGRFLSPDPYVQAPDFSQSYNRYSYCWNNPLRYTDPSGEWFGLDDLVVAGAGFIAGYLTHGISTGNWGWNAVAAGGVGAGMAWLGYNTAGLATGAITSATWNQVGGIAINSVASQFMPSISVPIGNNFALGISPGVGLGTSGLTGGLSYSATYSKGDFSIGAGFGVGVSGINGHHWGWNASVMDSRTGYGGGYGRTYYSASNIAGQEYGKQTVGSMTAYFNHNSFTFSNDILGDKEDRWRTNAVELSLGKYSIGTSLYTNWGLQESGRIVTDQLAPILNKNKSGAWTNGRVHFAPAWVGYRNKKGQTTRIGFSHPMVQNLTQNLIHKYVTPTPYFLNYDDFRSGGYFYSGYYNPHSLWEK